MLQGVSDTLSGVPFPLITQPYLRRGMVIPQVFKDLGEGVKRSWLFLIAGRPEGACEVA